MACSTTSGSAAGSLRSSFSSYYSANMPESSDKLPSSSFESLHSSTQSDHNTGFSTPEDAGPPWHVQQGLEAKTRTLSLDESNGANDDDDDEEEPVSVTMGRLSLSLTPSSHEAKVDVKSETMENSNTEEANVRWSSGTEETGGISEDSNITYESGMTTTTATTTSESVQKPTEDEIQAANARARPGTGPVTVQKATVIVGKAIAKAMAREHDVRTSSRLSETPEPPSLDTTEESIEPPSATPEPSEDEDITTHVTSSVTVSESEDDDHLRTLDTIPEEEEISERTESGRTRSRASFKNLVLPFDPNNVVELKPIPQPVRDVPIPRGWSKPTIEKTATSTEMNVNRGKDAGVKTKAESQPGRPEIDYVNEPMQRYVNVDSTANDNASSPEVIPQDYESISEVKREVDDSKFKKSEMTSKITHLVTPSPSKTKGEKSPVDVTTDTKKTQVGAGKKQRGRNKQGWDEATTSDISDGTYAKTTINSRSAGAYSTMTETSTVSAPASKSSKSESSGSSTDTKTTTNLAEAKAEAVKEDDTTEEISEEVSQTPSEVETTTTKSEASDKGGKENATKKQGIKSGGKTKGKGKKKGKAATKDQKASADSKRTQDDKETSENKNATNTDQEKPTPTTPTTPTTPSTSASTTVSKNTVTQNVTLPDPSPPASTTAITSNRMGIKSSSRKLTSLIKKRSTSLDSSEDSGEDFNDQAQPETTGISPATQEVPELLVQVPEILGKVEGLKARHTNDPDYHQVRELKEQIQMMRKQLEAKIEDQSTAGDGDRGPDSPDTPLDRHPLKGPVVLLQEPTKEPENEDTRRQYEQLKFDRTVRRLLAEGHTGSYEKAELATHLMSLDFEETMSITAAEECSSIYTALQFLQQECELCAEKYPMGKMVSMLHCIHRCCHDCAKTYFTFQIKTKNIREVRCPFCSEPDLDASEEIATEYFNNLDILLKNILDSGTHELFQRKLRDWTLMKDPNFRWCNKCSSGFIANPMARKLYCPDCRDVTCAQCRLPWESAHDGISCEEFAAWKADNNVEVSEATVSKHLAECGITCPNCKFTYSLAKGGCMHFTCIQCKFEFCSGCGQPFMQGARCPVGPYCERLGLHAHHPRNCLFYLRDKEPYQLQRLLKDAGIEFDIDSKEEKTICQVQEQKELPEGLIDDICGRVVPKGYAGLCRLHYTEYLVEKINGSRLDPVSIFDEADLRVCLRRNGKTVPVRRWESEKGYRDKLIKLIKEQLPLQ
ncbi:uncharacterized protein LOC143029731 [Oratosquilla oratoria]|uniref:uncharacterized protein LOC143029731 n=1 Tax=Oratosquilla oratoria TaxID=337810 RepID=UPI003F77411B